MPTDRATRRTVRLERFRSSDPSGIILVAGPSRLGFGHDRTGRADQVRAWCVGLLTPLAPVPTLRRIGLRPWNLPSWLTGTFSRVELPSGTLGGDGSLCALLQA
jgi:hypothetical protein